ncbi:glycosyltransferase family 4 protein [Escherichia coli]|nr:glycosyltransferase family 4 protein [Escherichia coli]
MSQKITVLGTRGIPDVPGGVETHCQNLYPAIKKQFDMDICVIARSPYVRYKHTYYKHVETYTLWAPKMQSLEAIVHSFLAACRTCFDGSDIVHVHAIGPGILVPLLRVLGKKVVFTHHGPDYDRQKWGRLAKMVLRLGEKMAVKYANEVIVISEVINKLIRKKYHRNDAHLIYNGVNSSTPLQKETLNAVLERYALQPHNYLIVVGRLVEEKGIHDAIAAYRRLGAEMPLVLVGDADHPTEYSLRLKKMAAETANVIMTGCLKGDELQAIFSQARLFIMPSYHEGLPIALLEAMSYSLPAVVSDIPANLEVQLPSEFYFEVGNVDALPQKIATLMSAERMDYSSWLKHYDWQMIARKTVSVYYSIDKKQVNFD